MANSESTTCVVCGATTSRGLTCSQRCVGRYAQQKRRRPFADTFWALVERGETESCWRWRGFVGDKGYGAMWHREDKRLTRAHRIAYELTHGRFDPSADVRHKCDNPICVNPSHLELGSHADNMGDMVKRGRSCRGEQKPDAKLTEADVRAIRERFAAGGITKQALAEQYGVCADTVRDVITRTKWRHVA
jgi:hypothetical protein